MFTTLSTSLPPLTLGAKTAHYPIIQGGMGVRISGANLAAAVANAGGVGVISSVGLGLRILEANTDDARGSWSDRYFEATKQALIAEIQTARALSPQGVIGINTMVADRHHDALMQAIADQPIDFIIAGAGLPLSLPRLVQPSPHIALIPIVASVRAARVLCRKWSQQYQRLPDGFIVESPGAAGGHLGAKLAEVDDVAHSVEAVVPQLVNYIRDELQAEIPVIAAGGIWDRADIDRMLALGASGVQLGTRFITTEECDADDRYKTYHLQARAEDVMLVPSPVGLPGRAIRNPFIEKVMAGESLPKTRCVNCLVRCKYRDQKETYCILHALNRAANGDVENGLIFAGSNAGKSDRLRSVADLMQELVGDATPQAAV
ncbi:NAD(P)H-dependent flavin oxidoreductase [Leptolyngbya iicbica]|uniref:Nitronate monooxygenase n=2 Tax=Cyanophyceae TaxID=3028117 RepID=A0A4Q7EAA9_9CYAN|nr:nitronate monooxygenase family protein [Leptolyngbya sp. LK]RZM79592.1 nitronate monooxygenase [Leptolyngbya sp. LK]